jgi:hypothetical protein
MGCKGIGSVVKDNLAVNLRDLDETGRLHYFYHSPSSDLPVRDVLNQLGQGYKTEPYLEKQAENYCCECMQPNIRGFLRGRERYLFLGTKCMKQGARYYGAHFVIGYLEKKKTRSYEWRPGGFYALLGNARVFSFRDAYPLESMINFRHFRRKVDERMTARILDHFDNGRSILRDYIIELERLKKELPERERRELRRKCR